MRRSFGAHSLRLFLTLAALGLAAPARASYPDDGDIAIRGVVLRPGVTVDVHLSVFANPRGQCEGKTILAVPGAAHTAATWAPFAEALFERRPGGRKFCGLVALDPPGHGRSGLPRGLLFGELTLDDYATVLLSTLQRLSHLGIRPHTVVAHSQGGLVVQLAQQRLAEAGTSLRRAFHVKRLLLFASAGPAPIPWAFVDGGAAGPLLKAFLTSDAVLGTHFALPDAFWVTLAFADLTGTIVTGAPTPAEVAARGWNAPGPGVATLQLVGAPPFARPRVAAGVFDPARGTRLLVVSYEQDPLIRPDENRLLYEHLTDDPSGALFLEVSGPGTVHDLHVADPQRLLDELADALERLADAGCGRSHGRGALPEPRVAGRPHRDLRLPEDLLLRPRRDSRRPLPHAAHGAVVRESAEQRGPHGPARLRDQAARPSEPLRFGPRGRSSRGRRSAPA